jgi:hypothetical protein
MCLIGSCLAGVAAVIALAERSRIPEGGCERVLPGRWQGCIRV